MKSGSSQARYHSASFSQHAPLACHCHAGNSQLQCLPIHCRFDTACGQVQLPTRRRRAQPTGEKLPRGLDLGETSKRSVRLVFPSEAERDYTHAWSRLGFASAKDRSRRQKTEPQIKALQSVSCERPNPRGEHRGGLRVELGWVSLGSCRPCWRRHRAAQQQRNCPRRILQ